MASDVDNDKNNWNELLISEQIVFALLGKILFEYPEQGWYETLASEEVFETIPFGEMQEDVQKGMKLLSAWNAQHSSGLSQEDFEDVRDDYTRLFVGPGKVLAPLWESMYFTKERTIFQEETLKVREWYRRFGLESVKLHSEPDDHLGLELAFIAHLAGQAQVALEQGDKARFQQFIQAQREFMTDHTLKWTGGWVALVLEHSRTDFFKGVSLVIRGILSKLKGILVEE